MKKYYANFWANNGTSFRNPIEDTNKKRLVSAIKDIAKQNRFAGNCASWEVWYRDGDNFTCVAAGYFDRKGNSHLYEEDELVWM